MNDITFLPAENQSGEDLPKIKVLGVGGAGGNAISHMIDKNLEGVEFIAINTDAKDLRNCKAPYKVQLGDSGNGAGAKPKVGQELAKAASLAIKDILNNTDMLFIAAGMGGGTGTGAAPVIARIAQEMEILTVAVVSKPFEVEGRKRMSYAENGISELSEIVNSLIVIHNEKLNSELPDDLTLRESLIEADNVLYNAVSGVSDIITEEGYIQVDFEDVRTIMKEAGESMMGSAIAEGENRAQIAAEKAINSPLLEGAELSDAKGAVVNIAASSASFKRKEFNIVMEEIKKYTVDDAIIIGGVIFTDNLGESMKVTVIITGLGRVNSTSVLSSDRTSTETPLVNNLGNRFSNINASIGNRVSQHEGHVTNSDGSLNIPVFGLTSYDKAKVNSPSVMRSRTRTQPLASEVNDEIENRANKKVDQKSITGILAGEETATITNGDLSHLRIPSFMRKQAGSGGNN